MTNHQQPHARRLLRAASLAIAAFSLLAASAVQAATFTYFVQSTLGLDDGHACLSTAGAGLCAAEATFTVDGAYALTGTIVYDDVASTVDLDITLASGSFDGSHDGVDEVVFTSLNYVVDDLSVLFASGGMLLTSGGTGTVTGTYEQFNSGGSVVAASAFGPTAVSFNGLSCNGLGGVGLCGITAGGARDFTLDVGTTGTGDATDFVHTLNFNTVVPEPGTGALMSLGLVALARRRRA